MMTLRGAVAYMLLPRYAGGALPSPVAGFVRDAIAAEPALAEAYTALRRVERTAGRPAPLSAGQRDLLEAALFSDARFADGAVSDGAEVRALSGTGVLGLLRLGPVAAAGACVVLFALSSGGADEYGAGDLEARGATLAQDPLGVKVSCVQGERVVDTATAGARRPTDSMACPGEGLLAFALTNLSQQERWVFVVGVARDGDARWYAPFERGAAAVRAAPGKDNDVLPVLGDMRGMPADESVTLHVLLSDRPFAGADVERQLTAARARGVPLGSVERLPLPDIPLQARVDMVLR